LFCFFIELTTQGIQGVKAEGWEGYCRNVQKLEDEYWARDGIAANVIRKFIINVQDDGRDDESSSDSSSSMESDSELAQPFKVKQYHNTPMEAQGERMYSSYSFTISALDGVSTTVVR
jgi:hypothetical protein